MGILAELGVLVLLDSRLAAQSPQAKSLTLFPSPTFLSKTWETLSCPVMLII